MRWLIACGLCKLVCEQTQTVHNLQGFISTIYQDLIADYIKENDVKIDKKMSEKIKTVSERQHLNDKTLFEILNGKISEEVKVKPKKTSIKVSKKMEFEYSISLLKL